MQGDRDSVGNGVGRQPAEFTGGGKLEEPDRAVLVRERDLLRTSEVRPARVWFRQDPAWCRSVQLPHMDCGSSTDTPIELRDGDELAVATQTGSWPASSMPAAGRSRHRRRRDGCCSCRLDRCGHRWTCASSKSTANASSRPWVPGSSQVKIGHGQRGDRGVSQLLKVRHGQFQRPDQLRCLPQSFEALEALAQADGSNNAHVPVRREPARVAPISSARSVGPEPMQRLPSAQSASDRRPARPRTSASVARTMPQVVPMMPTTSATNTAEAASTSPLFRRTNFRSR